MRYPFMVSTPEAMAKQIVNFCRRPNHPDYQQALEAINDTFSAEKQRTALIMIYGS